MKLKKQKPAFSLTEMLLAIGTLAVGLLFIAGAFPVAIHFAARSTEQSIASAVADEAFATIKLYAEGNPNSRIDDVNLMNLRSYQMKPFKIIDTPANVYEEDIFDILPALNMYDPNIAEVFAYSSTNEDYYWSPMFRGVGDANDSRLVQVTIFVCRISNPNARFYWPDPDPTLASRHQGKVNIDSSNTNSLNPVFGLWPEPVKVDLVMPRIGTRWLKNEMLILPTIGDGQRSPPNPGPYNPPAKTKQFINQGSIIVNDKTGQVYRVLRRYKQSEPISYDQPPQFINRPFFNTVIKLDRDWHNNLGPSDIVSVWVVPPPSQGGRSPCVGVFQKVIRF